MLKEENVVEIEDVKAKAEEKKSQDATEVKLKGYEDTLGY